MRYLENLQTELAMALKCQLILNHSGEKPARAFHRLVDIITDLRGISALYLEAILGAQVDKDTARVVDGEVTRMLEEGEANAQMMRREADAGGAAVSVAQMFSEEEDVDEEGGNGESSLQWTGKGGKRSVGSCFNDEMEEDQQDSRQSDWSEKSEDKSSSSTLEEREENMTGRRKDSEVERYDMAFNSSDMDKEYIQRGQGKMEEDGSLHMQSADVPMEESLTGWEHKDLIISADSRQSESHFEEACAKLRRFGIKESDIGHAAGGDGEINNLRSYDDERGKCLPLKDSISQEGETNAKDVHCTLADTRSNSPGRLTRKRSATFSIGCKRAQKCWRVHGPDESPRVRPSSAPAGKGLPLVEGTPLQRSRSTSHVGALGAGASEKTKTPTIRLSSSVPSAASRSKSFSQGDRAMKRSALKAKAGWKKAILHEQNYESQDSLLARCPRISALIMEPDAALGQSYPALTQSNQYNSNTQVYSGPKPDHGVVNQQEKNFVPSTVGSTSIPGEKSKPHSGIVRHLFSMGPGEIGQAYSFPGQAQSDIKSRDRKVFTIDPNFDLHKTAKPHSTLYSLMNDQPIGSGSTGLDQLNLRTDHSVQSNRPRSNTWSALAADKSTHPQLQMPWSRAPKIAAGYPTIQDQSITFNSSEAFHPPRHASFPHPVNFKTNMSERHSSKTYHRPQGVHSTHDYLYKKAVATSREGPVTHDPAMVSQMLPPQGTRDHRTSFQSHHDDDTRWENQVGQEHGFTHRRNTLPSRPNRWRASSVRFSPLCQESNIQVSPSSHAQHTQSHSQNVPFVHNNDSGNPQIATAPYPHIHATSTNHQPKTLQSFQGYPGRADNENRFYHSGAVGTSPTGDSGISWSSLPPPHQRSASFSHGSRSNNQSQYNQRRSTYTFSRKALKPGAHNSQSSGCQMEGQPSRFAPSPSQNSLSSSASSSLSSVWSLGSASSSSSSNHASHYQQGHTSYPSSPDSGVSDVPLDMSCPTRTYVPKSLSSTATASSSSNSHPNDVDTSSRESTTADKQCYSEATSIRSTIHTDQNTSQKVQNFLDSPSSPHLNYSPNATSCYSSPSQASVGNTSQSTVPLSTLAPKPSYMNKTVTALHSTQERLSMTGDRSYQVNQQFTPSATSAFDLTRRATSTANNINSANTCADGTASTPLSEHTARSSYSNQCNYNASSQSNLSNTHHSMSENFGRSAGKIPASYDVPLSTSSKTSPKVYISPDQEVQNLSMLSSVQAFRSAPPSPSGQFYENHPLSTAHSYNSPRERQDFATASARGHTYLVNTSEATKNSGTSSTVNLENEYKSDTLTLREKLRLRLNPKAGDLRNSEEQSLVSIGRSNLETSCTNNRLTSGQFNQDLRTGDCGKPLMESAEQTWNPPVCRPRSQTYSGRPREDRLSRTNIERLLLQAPSKSYLLQQQPRDQQQQ